MKKILTILNTLLIVLSVFFITACKNTSTTVTTKKEENKTAFDFDDDYFVGLQEHIYEIRAMEPMCNYEYVCDMVKAMGTKVFRLNVTLVNLFYVDVNDTVKFNQSTKDTMRIVVDNLKRAGVERIIYSTDTFIFPYGYKSTHDKATPDPYTERNAYVRFLEVIGKAYGLIAEEFPEINYFEQINEPDIPNAECIVKNGMQWGAQSPEFMYSAFDEANICVDLCYYSRKAVKEVNPENKMLTPALSSLATCLDYLEYMYQAIESGAHPTGDTIPCSVDPDDYFDCLVFHPYSSVVTVSVPDSPRENGIYLISDAYKNSCMKFYDVCVKHGDAEKPHWYTEIGFTDQGDPTKREIIGRETTKQLEMIKNELPFVECVVFYVLCDLYTYNVDINENNFGLFTNPANPEAPMEMKPIAKAIYKYIHNGSEDYSAFDALREKYCKGVN